MSFDVRKMKTCQFRGFENFEMSFSEKFIQVLKNSFLAIERLNSYF